MLIQVHRVDENGFYDEPVLIKQDELIEEENIITVDPPDGLFHPRWTGTEWIEGLTAQEIEERTKPQPLPPDPVEERMNEMQANFDAAIMELTRAMAVQQGGV